MAKLYARLINEEKWTFEQITNRTWKVDAGYWLVVEYNWNVEQLPEDIKKEVQTKLNNSK